VLLACLPGEYQAVGAAWTLYGMVGAVAGLVAGVLLVPMRNVRAEWLWCTAFLLVAVPLAGVLGLAAIDAQLYDEAGVPLADAGTLAGALVLAGALAWWMGRNLLTKTPLRILATPRGTLAGWGAGLVLAWIFALSPAPPPTHPVPPSTRPPADAPDLVLVVVESLRTDTLGAYGAPAGTTPHLDALARDGVVFEQAVAASTRLKSAMASLFTSLAVSTHGCGRRGDVLAPGLLTLAEAVADRGYRTAGLPNNASVSAARGFGQGFESYGFVPRYPLGARESTAELLGFRVASEVAERFAGARAPPRVSATGPEVVAAAASALASTPNSPIFLMLHLVEPAAVPPRDLDQMGPPPGSSTLLPAVPAEASVADAARVDEAVGGLIAELRAAGRYDRALIVVTTDHGAPLVPARDGSATMREESVHIPLIVKLPRGEWAGTRALWQVRSIDIAPTLVDAAGGRPDRRWQGIELFPDSFEADLALLQPPAGSEDEGPPPGWAPPHWGNHPASRDALVESMRAGVTTRALRRGGLKVVATLFSPRSGSEIASNMEFYDLSADPDEQQDLSADQSSQQAGMRAAMESMVADRRRKAFDSRPPAMAVGGDRCARCALGYLSPEECAACETPSISP
jgi:arylsulfatase A-like enzyme